jgi:hypothetical protein
LEGLLKEIVETIEGRDILLCQMDDNLIQKDVIINQLHEEIGGLNSHISDLEWDIIVLATTNDEIDPNQSGPSKK